MKLCIVTIVNDVTRIIWGSINYKLDPKKKKKIRGHSDKHYLVSVSHMISSFFLRMAVSNC